jgi:starch synthase
MWSFIKIDCKHNILVNNCINFCNFAWFFITNELSKLQYEDKRILYVSSEVVPYLAENEVSLMSYDVPKMVNDQGGQIRILCLDMETSRRHQLHEVIRLSGMNWL